MSKKKKPITFDEFLDICREKADVYADDYKERKNIIYVKWTTGGMTGASCYDTGTARMRPTESEPEPEFNEIDKILEIFSPNINFLQYKNLLTEVIEREEDGYSDFYGNYDKYGIKLIDMRKLFDALLKRGYIKNG